MALAIAFDEAKAAQVTRTGDGRKITGGRTQIPFFRFVDDLTLPHASLNRYHAGRVSRTHFHTTDQFQVVIDGKGRLGRHELAPYCVHFSRAYTPYGPFVADSNTDLTFFVMRARHDPGARHLPDARDQLISMPNRRPWQVSRSIRFADTASDANAGAALLKPITGMQDDQGLAAYTLSMRPNTRTEAPDLGGGDGQYLVVVEGSLLHTERDLRAPALVFVMPGEGAFQIRAGGDGLKAFILNFPASQRREATRISASVAK